jgi:hypothetical protein
MEVQVGRQLDEDEVRRINFIIKSRAYRFVAAAETEWLYPERHLPKRIKWSKLSDGYLLFPDPRELHHGGEIIIGLPAAGQCPAMPTEGRRSTRITARTACQRPARISSGVSRAGSPGSSAQSAAATA